ncbi:MAG TPA: hypothetical protein VGH30_07405 [Jatrophihabitantaceae bacterium]
MARPIHLAAAAAVSACVAGLVLAPAANAATHHSSHHTTRPFVAHGMLVKTSANSVTVLAHDVHTGRSVAKHEQITVALPSGTKGARTLRKIVKQASSGDRVTVNGRAESTGHGPRFTANEVTDHAAPFHLYLGSVTAVDGTTVTVNKADDPSDDQGEDDNGSFTVDVSTAAISVDGAAGDLAPGQSVAILGAENDDTVVATSVWAFTVAPATLFGEVRSVDGTVVTLKTDDDGDQGGDDNAVRSDDHGHGHHGDRSDVSVDLADVPLVLNGNSGATVDQLGEGTRIVLLGSTDPSSGAFTPSMGFAFSHDCSSRHHGDGGQDDNGDGGHGGHGGHGGGDGGDD